MSTHSLGWQDAGMAALHCSDDTKLDQILTAPGYKMDDDPDVCGACGAKVRLI